MRLPGAHPKLRLSGLQSRAQPPGGARRPDTGSESQRRPVRGWVSARARPSRPPALPPSPRRRGPPPGAAMLGARAWQCLRLLLPRAGPGLVASRRYKRASGLLRRALRLRGPRAGYPDAGPQCLPGHPLIPDPILPSQVCSSYQPQSATPFCPPPLLAPPLPCGYRLTARPGVLVQQYPGLACPHPYCCRPCYYLGLPRSATLPGREPPEIKVSF